jgi:transcriptional regulator of aromatic amino acid metabolism
MGPTLQAKLLRFLEEKTFKRVGGSDDVRVRRARQSPRPTATLARMVREGRFRDDLYYTPSAWFRSSCRP